MKKDTLITVLAISCVFCLAFMVLALCLGNRPEEAPFTPPPFDSTAVTGTPTVPEELSWQELDAKAFRVGVCGVVTLQGNSADIWLTNHEDNTVWLKARLLDEQGEILGETGLIRPGEYVQTVQFTKAPNKGDKIRIKVMSYTPDVYTSEGVASFETTIS